MDSSTLYISWTAPPIAERNGVIRNYLITILELETGQSFSVASASASVTVPSLHPYYTYVCAVTAVTVEEGPYSANKTIRLPEDGKHTRTITKVGHTYNRCTLKYIYLQKWKTGITSILVPIYSL